MPLLKSLPATAGTCIYMGVDPGASGGAAVIDAAGVVVELKSWANLTLQDQWRWFERWRQLGDLAVFAVIEKVQGYIGDAQPASSAFKFGSSYGALLAFLVAARIPHEEITPQGWLKGLGIPQRKKSVKGKQGESKTQWKNRLKGLAQATFPEATFTLATADAALIAELCRRKRQGLLAADRV